MELFWGNDTWDPQQGVEVDCDFGYTKNLQDWTAQEIKEKMMYSTLEAAKTKIIVPVIFVVGILGNFAFFFLLARVKKMRTITNFHLANLAVADIMVLFVKIGYLMSSPYYSVIVWSEPFKRHAGCALHILLCALSYCASIMLITFISFDRYFAICRPLQYRNMKTKKGSVIIVSCIWIVSALFSIPIVMRLGKLMNVCIIWPSEDIYETLPDFGQYCDPFHPVFKTVFYVLMTIPFTIAIIMNTILYIKIVSKLKQPLPGDNSSKDSNQKIMKRITWMLLINSMVFFLCLAPTQFLILTAFSVEHPSALHTVLIHTAFILIMVNSAINPIIYIVANPTYRRGFLKAFGIPGSQIEPSSDDSSKESKEITKSTHAP